MQGAKILLLDDDRETRWALATVLRREGGQVTEGGDGEEGMRFLLRARYDLCISDVCMPALGGYGLYAALRYGASPDLEWARTMPVLLISGKVAPRDLAQALDAGVDDFIEKPCDPEEFKARVRAVLRRSKLMYGPKTRTHGSLGDFGMASLAQAIHLGGRTARVSVQTHTTHAIVDFHRGQISHAQYEEMGGSLRGEEAAVRGLALEDGLFEILPVPESAARSVFEDTPGLLLRAATLRDETGEIARLGPIPGSLPVSGPPGSGA